MTAVSDLGKGLYQSGEFSSTLLSGDIQAFFSAPAAAQKILVNVTNDMQIFGWSIFGSASGSCVVDVWRTSITGAGLTMPVVPVVGNSIAGTLLPTLVTATAAKAGSPPGYQPAATSFLAQGWGGAGVAANAGQFLNAGDLLIFNINSYTAGGSILVFLHTSQGS